MGSQFKFLVGSSLKTKTIMKASKEIMKQNFLLFFFYPERTEKLFLVTDGFITVTVLSW